MKQPTIWDYIKDHKESKKDRFLKSIESKTGKYKYKRVSVSPIRYAGGKSKGVGYIIELLPKEINKVVSPFFGGGSVEITISKHLGLEVHGYDIFDILTNYWKFQIEKPEELYQELSKWGPCAAKYTEVKNRLEDHWDLSTKTFQEWTKTCRRSKRYKGIKESELENAWASKKLLDDFDLATHYYFNFNLSYGPGFLGWASKTYLNEKRYSSILKTMRDFKPGNLKVDTGDFKDIIKKHGDDFLYCDPPYFIGPESKMFKGIYPMRNIPIHHNGFDHHGLAYLLNNHRGGFILSYNDCPQVREWYKDFSQSFPVWQYTMGQGETRIGKNRKDMDSDHIKDSHEILIFSPPKN